MSELSVTSPNAQLVRMSEPTAASPNTQSILTAWKIVHHPDWLLPYLGQFRRCESAANWTDLQGLVPITMEIDLTNLCSHRCPLCMGRRAAQSEQEDLFTIAGDCEPIPTDRAADDIRQMAATGLRFTGGGEPTVHPDLEALVARACSLGMDVALTTHAGLLQWCDVSALVANCTGIRVSVDAACAEEYQGVHGCGRADWERVWKSISRLTSATRLSEAAGRRRATIGVGHLAGPDNVDRLPQFAQLCRDRGVDYTQVWPIYRYVDCDVTDRINDAQQGFGNNRFQVVGSLQKYCQIANNSSAPPAYTFYHISQFASVSCANQRMCTCCHHPNLDAFCIGGLRTQGFMDIVSSVWRARVSASIHVSACQPLCRGDSVNRCIAEVDSNSAPFMPPKPAPPHVSFL